MKTKLSIIGILCALFIQVHANNPLRKVPYPQQENSIYLNPAPLLVPLHMKQSDFLQFNLSQDKNFKGDDDILSKPVPFPVEIEKRYKQWKQEENKTESTGN